MIQDMTGGLSRVYTCLSPEKSRDRLWRVNKRNKRVNIMDGWIQDICNNTVVISRLSKAWLGKKKKKKCTQSVFTHATF